MRRTFALLSLTLVLGALFLGCKREHSAPAPGRKPATVSPGQPTSSSGYFRTPFQNEVEYVVTAIASDLAEQLSFAASHAAPARKTWCMVARERPGRGLDQPVLELNGRLGPQQQEVKTEITVAGPIWSPEVYGRLAEELAGALEFNPTRFGTPEDLTLLEKLTDGQATTLEQENQQLSATLESDFTNPELHERAALLLSAFLLRGHSGKFFEIRAPLCRLTAHLAMAEFLRHSPTLGINGQLAEAAMLALVNDGAMARDHLKRINNSNPGVAAFIRALLTRATGDFRPLSNSPNRSALESYECFSAMADYLGSTLAWTRFAETDRTNITCVRAANEFGYSVTLGHQLLALSLPLELREMQTIYELWHGQSAVADWLDSFNAPPEGCFTAAADGATKVRIIGWGQWANFCQRHLCQAVQENFNFLQHKWAVPEEARKFAERCDRQFGDLWMYAFVRRFNCTDAASYHRAVDDGLALTISSPHLVPAECWNYLCYKPDFAERYLPNPNPHLNEWHFHNPLPGTVYDLAPRLDQPSLVNRADAVEKFERLHEMAPFDCRICEWLLEHRPEPPSSFKDAMELYLPVMGYSRDALVQLAERITDKPLEYERLMLQAAELDPSSYYALGDYALAHQQRDKAAGYYEKGSTTDPDPVRAAERAAWRVQYYLSKKQTEKARALADAAAEVYSYSGLAAKAGFFESTTNYDEAFQWYQKIEERYGESAPLLGFCQRHKARTGSYKFDLELEKRMRKLFPFGEERVNLRDFGAPPNDGVLINGENELLKSAGLKEGDVIVAAYGFRARNLDQYAYLRDSRDTPKLELIVWQGDGYHLVTASPPDHRFGVDFQDYRP